MAMLGKYLSDDGNNGQNMEMLEMQMKVNK